MGGERGLLKKNSFNKSKGSGSNSKSAGEVPKGYLAIKVGGEGEEQQRFIVPVIYINHPLFLKLLKEAEEEYGFDQKGAITIPCHVDEFRNVQGIIEEEKSQHQQQQHHSHHHHYHHNHRALVGCFRA